MKRHHFLALLVAAMSACSTAPNSAIEGDGDGDFGSLMLTVPFDSMDVEMLDGLDFVTGIQLLANRGEGDFDQELSAVESVQLDSVAFAGPGLVNVDVEHSFLGVGVFGSKAGESFGYGGAIGLGYSSLDVRAKGVGLSDSLEVEELGFYFDGTLDYSVAGPVSLFYNLYAFQGLGGEAPEIFQVRLGAAWSALGQLRVSAGLQNWEYVLERDVESDLRLELEGLFVELQFTP